MNKPKFLLTDWCIDERYIWPNAIPSDHIIDAMQREYLTIILKYKSSGDTTTIKNKKILKKIFKLLNEIS